MQPLDTPSSPCETRQARYRTGINQLCAPDRAAHDWYRFILSFPPHLVRDYLQRFGVGAEHCVLDPFCGTGTTLVECKKLGVPSVGVEANRVAQFASAVKVNWQPNPDGLLAHANQIAALVRADLAESGIDDTHALLRLPLFEQGLLKQKVSPSLRSLSEEQNKLLLKNSISPLPLHKTLVLLDRLKQESETPHHQHELLALTKAIVFSISNLQFGPEVGVGRAKEDAPVVEAWLAAVRAIVDDLRVLQPLTTAVTATVHHADARQLLTVLEPNSIDAVITSPPYPNEKDYTRTTRLESVLLGFIETKADLRALKQGLMRSNTRNVYTADTDDQWVVDQAEVQQIAATIEARRLELGKTSGFERVYGRATKLYFGGMARHLAELRPILRPGAQLAYVVGDQASYFRVLIRTGRILADIAQTLGYEVVSIDLFRTRLSTATKAQLREEVVVLRWRG